MEHNHSMDINGTPWFVHQCTIELDRNAQRIVLFLLYLFIFTVGLLENLLVLWVNWRRWRTVNGILFCVLNVCLSDMMMIVTLPFFMMEAMIQEVWLWGEFLCKVTNLVYAVNFYSSTFFLALMTLERYLSLTKPAFPALFSVAGWRRWGLCGGVWLFSLFLALFENVQVNLLEWDEPGCLTGHDYFDWNIAIASINFIFQFLGPGAVIITCNVLISRALRADPDLRNPRDVRLVHVYSLVFVLCWLPYHLVVVLIDMDTQLEVLSCNALIAIYYLYDIVKIVSLFHCVANPILYNFLNKSFCTDLIKTLMSYISKGGSVAQMGAGTRPNREGGVPISNASTSQSDVDS